MICPVCGEPFDHRASSHQGPECDRCSEEKMSDNISRDVPVIPPEVKLALRVLLNHVEPGWDNCKTAVQLWLDAAPCGCATCVLPNICPDGDECQDAQFHAPAPQPWTEGELAKAMHAERLEREGCRSNYADERWDENKSDRERWYASARVALSRPLAGPVVADYEAGARAYVEASIDQDGPIFYATDEGAINLLTRAIIDAAIGEGKP